MPSILDTKELPPEGTDSRAFRVGSRIIIVVVILVVAIAVYQYYVHPFFPSFPSIPYLPNAK